MLPQWSVVCVKSHYAGQGHSWEAGDLYHVYYTPEEAHAVCEKISEGWSHECWEVRPYDSFTVNTERGKRAAKRIEENWTKLDACPKPHEFLEPEKTKPWGEPWVCHKCGGSMARTEAGWYMMGVEHGRKDAK